MGALICSSAYLTLKTHSFAQSLSLFTAQGALKMVRFSTTSIKWQKDTFSNQIAQFNIMHFIKLKFNSPQYVIFLKV